MMRFWFTKVWAPVGGFLEAYQDIRLTPWKAIKDLDIAEREVTNVWLQKLKDANLSTKPTEWVNLSPEKQAQIQALKTDAQKAHPHYAHAKAEIDEAIAHKWHSAPGPWRSWLSGQVAMGLLLGGVAAAGWKFGYADPYNRKMEDYYKQLYAKYPEYWPALATHQKAKKH